MRRNKSNTMTLLSTPQLNRLITDNREVLQHSNVIPKELLYSWFAITPLSDSPSIDEVRQHDFNLFNAYTSMNKLLRKRGLVMKKKKDTYCVLGLASAKEKALGYLRVSDRNVVQRQELKAGISRYQSVWSPLSDVELSRIRD